MGHLRITFAGVCTHFTTLRTISRTLPPLRIVLPATGDFRLGYVLAGWVQDRPPISYYLQPHFSTMRIGTETTPNVEGFVGDGFFYSAAKIEVENASDTPSNALQLSDWYQNPRYSLATYVSNYALSEDVVINGRAMCYIDLAHGVVTSPPPSVAGDMAASVVADIDTDGPPRLKFTPLSGTGESTTLPLDDSADILISNLEYDAGMIEGDTPFDFIQHYETSRRGKPAELLLPLPGMPLDPIPLLSVTAQEIAGALTSLARAVSQFPGSANFRGFRPTREQILAIDPATLNPSCSDSHYP